MFYFASDNPLAPSIIPQLKSIKQAGFHQEVNVVAHFDPHTEGAPTHIFDINHVNKLKAAKSTPAVTSRVGFSTRAADDPFVSKLLEDKLWGEETDRHGDPIRSRLLDRFKGISYDPPVPPSFTKKMERAEDGEPEAGDGAHLPAASGGPKMPDGDGYRDRERDVELSPRESLEAFLGFCAENYPARHYVLFILGHGVVVANDIFLFDENADAQSLSLRGLRTVLDGFRAKVEEKAKLEGFAPAGELELVSFHSCSVSSVEVAYELQGAANYMLASQGPAFVGSWPYRQILMRMFKGADSLKGLDEKGEREEVRQRIRETFRTIADYCFHNSNDFLLAGYSFDVTLCDLTAVSDHFTQPLIRLREALVRGLDNPLVNSLILLAHLKAQSHWEENYTDLRDFCQSLGKLAEEIGGMLAADSQDPAGKTVAMLDDLIKACDVVKGLVQPSELGPGVIAKTEFIGPEHQYSHGLSIYFPWTRPVEDRLASYCLYKFDREVGWFQFLDAYFNGTLRPSRSAENNGVGAAAAATAREPVHDELQEDMASLIFVRSAGRGNGVDSLALPAGKVNPNDKTGGECTCPSIKNYPRDTRDPRSRRRSAPEQQPDKGFVPISQGDALLSNKL